jgi:hypothetical protein
MPFEHPSFDPPPQSVSPAKGSGILASIKAASRALASPFWRTGTKNILPVMLSAAALFAPCAMNAQNDTPAIPIPHEMRFCGQNCLDFTLEGNNQLVNRTNLPGQQNEKRVLTIEKFAPDSVIIHRVDTGSFPINGVTYEGKMEPGNNAVHGANWRIRWGDAIRSQPDGIGVPNTISRGNEERAKPQQPTQAADWTKEPFILPEHEPVVEDFHIPGKLNLSGQWEASKITPDKKIFVVARVEIRQQDDRIEVVNADDRPDSAGVSFPKVTTFKGQIRGSEIEGLGPAPGSTPTNILLTSPVRIHVDDPDHVHFEAGDKMPLHRLNPRADDAPCDARNSAHVALGWAFERGRDAKFGQKNFLKSACWFQIEALSGNAQAQAQLAWHFENGNGVATNYDQAFAWAQKSAAQNNMLGEWVLANLYDQGRGVTADKRKAHALRERLAYQSNIAILSNPDAKTPSGLTVGQVLKAAGEMFDTTPRPEQESWYESKCHRDHDESSCRIYDDLRGKREYKEWRTFLLGPQAQ